MSRCARGCRRLRGRPPSPRVTHAAAVRAQLLAPCIIVPQNASALSTVMVVLALGDLSVRTLTEARGTGDPRRPYETLAVRNEGIELLMVTGSPLAAVSRRTARLHGESAELIHRFGFDVEMNTLKARASVRGGGGARARAS